MYTARVHRIQETDITFSDLEYDEWRLANPSKNHSHENYIGHIVEMIIKEDACWNTSDAEIVCIVYSRDDQG